MLSGLSPDAAECYRRAAECRELAELAADTHDRDFYLPEKRNGFCWRRPTKRRRDWIFQSIRRTRPAR